ncbi:MAG: hypothetical protein DME32_15640, partial [Verrucomicrobia bacterium]
MTKLEGNPNAQMTNATTSALIHSDLVIPSSFVIRHSSFATSPAFVFRESALIVCPGEAEMFVLATGGLLFAFEHATIAG